MTLHGLHVLYPESEFPEYGPPSLRLWDCGVAWRDIHLAPGEYDWSRLDLIVAMAKDEGIRDLLYVACGTPEWLAEDQELPHYARWLGPGSNSRPTGMYEWKQFLRLLVRRYPTIKAVQIWNEPQLKDFWGYDNWSTLGDMTIAAYQTIRKYAPKCKIVSAPVLPRPSSGGMKRGGRYLQTLALRGWPVDVVAAHIYPVVGAGPDTWNNYARAVHAKLREMDAPYKPLWVTETNFNLLGGPIDESRVADYLRWVNAHCHRTGVDRVYWYAYGTHTDPRLLGVPFSAQSPGTAVLKALELSRRKAEERL